MTVLQESVKMTSELAAGLKSGILQAYLDDPLSDPNFFDITHDLLLGSSSTSSDVNGSAQELQTVSNANVLMLISLS